MGEIMTFEPTEAQFGVFWKYLQRPNVTEHFYAQYFQLRESSVQ